MKKPWLFLLKVLVLLIVGGFVTWQVRKSWLAVQEKNITIDWQWGLVAMAGFAASMLTSAWVWRVLAGKMAGASNDRQTHPRGDGLPTIPLLGAYTYSQMGKYVWKVFLVLMRIERAGRVGMPPEICAVSTLLENVLYMISGGLVGMVAIVRLTGELTPAYRALLWPVTLIAVAVLIAACAPPVFYGIVNRALRGMKRPELPRLSQLRAGTLILAVISFIPCWIFGAFAMWGAMQCVDGGHSLPLLDYWWFAGAFALSVIIGMASLLPGGAGIRDAAMGAAMALQFSQMGLKHEQAVLMGAAAAVLLRLFQVITEVLLGGIGMMLTRKRKPFTA